MIAKTVLGNVVGSVKLKKNSFSGRQQARTKLQKKYGPEISFEIIKEGA